MEDHCKMKWALGLMSGTSMDGIDVALLRTDGEMQVERGPSMTFPYSPAHRGIVEEAMRHAVHCQTSAARPGRLFEAEQLLTELNAAAVSAFLRKTGFARDDIDVIGFHGQTVLHQPDKGLTVQLGDGALLAEFTRCPVVFDLRANDVAAGGEGAPLAPAYHRAMVSNIAERPIAVLNIGGVANVTWIGPDGALLAFDTGPGNALLDDWVREKAGVPYDVNGDLARQGQSSPEIVSQFLLHPFLQKQPPKSLDRGSFNGADLRELSVVDGAATLVDLTVACISNAQAWMPVPPTQWVVVGGGRHNTFLMQRLSEQLDASVRAAEDIELNGDSVEAEAWAYLAVRSRRGLPITFPETTGVSQPMTGGRFIDLPRRPTT
jgi:anhydro-N-acetylmuramic acid kinase